MKILLLNYEFPPLGGGASNATFNIAKELVLLGYNVEILTSGINGSPPREELHGFIVHRVFSLRRGIHDCGMRGAYTYVWNAAFRLNRVVRNSRFDVLHYFFSLPTGLLTLAPGRHGSVPYIVSLRGSDVPGYDPWNRMVQMFHILLKPVTRYIWKRAARVVALSDALRATALETTPGLEIDIIPNGVEADLFKPDGNKSSENSDFKLITVSRLIRRKGVQHILKALKRINDPSIKLLIVGTGDYEQQLKNLADKLKLHDQVTFYGYCSRDCLPALYNQMDAFILPSMAESFGIVFAEAMACRLPVIGGRIGGVPDLVKDDNGILVEPGNIDEIKSAILRLKSSKALCRDMGAVNRKKVVDHYSWRSVALQYSDIYERIP